MVLTMASIRGALGDLVNGGGDSDREATKNVGGDGGGEREKVHRFKTVPDRW